MKKKKLIVIGIILTILAGVLGYFGTEYIDKLRKGKDVKVSVTFEDTKEFTIENNHQLSKDEALLEWPYIFHMENTGNDEGLYQIKIIDNQENTIKREDLSYLLYINSQEVANKKLNEIKDDVLYQGNIDKNTKLEFKLYIWSNKDYQDEDLYKYLLDINVIKTGGPGF